MSNSLWSSINLWQSVPSPAKGPPFSNYMTIIPIDQTSTCHPYFIYDICYSESLSKGYPSSNRVKFSIYGGVWYLMGILRRSFLLLMRIQWDKLPILIKPSTLRLPLQSGKYTDSIVSLLWVLCVLESIIILATSCSKRGLMSLVLFLNWLRKR